MHGAQLLLGEVPKFKETQEEVFCYSCIRGFEGMNPLLEAYGGSVRTSTPPTIPHNSTLWQCSSFCNIVRIGPTMKWSVLNLFHVVHFESVENLPTSDDDDYSRVMNVAPWECLPIAILMQILATCACTTVIGPLKSSSTAKFQFIFYRWRTISWGWGARSQLLEKWHGHSHNIAASLTLPLIILQLSRNLFGNPS